MKQDFLSYAKVSLYALALLFYTLFVGMFVGFYHFFKAIIDEGKISWRKLQEMMDEK